jgi:WhiB family redox-sensing transcriptional regulator
VTLAEDLDLAEAQHAFYLLLVSGRDPPNTPTELVGRRPAWEARAACRGMGSEVNFFPDRGESLEPARAICARCPVREPCLELALAPMEGGLVFGIWGGTSARERVRLRKAKR